MLLSIYITCPPLPQVAGWVSGSSTTINPNVCNPLRRVTNEADVCRCDIDDDYTLKFTRTQEVVSR